jgi:hypothetical protein
MFLLNINLLYTLTIFFIMFWNTFVLSVILYVYPRLGLVTFNYMVKPFKLLNVSTLYLPLFVLYLTYWVSNDIVIWFGHVVITPLTFKYMYFMSFWVLLTLYVIDVTFKYLDRLRLDYIIIILNLYPWVLYIVTSTNLFSFIFLLELITIIIFMLIPLSPLMLINKNNIRFNYFNSNTYYSLIHSLLFYYWVSFVTTSLLFLNIFLYFITVFNLEWLVSNFVIGYYLELNLITTTYKLYVLVLLFIIIFFIKFGLLPFFVWKLIFFKGVDYIFILTYIIIYFNTLLYSFLCIFYIYITSVYNIISILSLVTLVSTLPYLLIHLFNYLDIKAFFAVSSLFNTTLLLLTINLML